MSTPPLSSSSSSASSPSPSMKPTHLDPDDPLNLEYILQSITDQSGMLNPHMNSQMNPSADPNVLGNWNQDAKMAGFDFDFNFALSNEFDFDQSMAVNPSALHFNSMVTDQSPFAPSTDGSYFTPTPAIPDDSAGNAADYLAWVTQSHPSRRLSVASSSSSSGASLSPVMDSISVSSSPPSEGPVLSDPAHELAQKVRQMAGVTLAVPVSVEVQQMAAASQAKLPIPRLPRPPMSKQGSMKSSPYPESSSPPAMSFSPKSDSPAEATPPPVQSVIGRPKTSHTTIERRYRTNLNARITGLKQAVPALRVLEAKVSGQENPFNDFVDGRGFVDGVKVARKMSKANVLGKAAEYIRVLKKREARLNREQDGLKSLISGLVGGPALLKEWEREWRARFGGEEKDEIEEEAAGAASDDEDGDGDESDGEEGEEGRARKKAKVLKAAKKEKPVRPAAPSTPVIPTAPGAMPEKRKRGRPRKVPLPPATVPTASTTTSPMEASPSNALPIFPIDSQMQEVIFQTPAQAQQQQQQTQQYLLAAFAFFSVLNSPLTASHKPAYTPTHEHTGAVLTPLSPTQSQLPMGSVSPFGGFGLHELVQAAHLLVSTLLVFYVILPYLTNFLLRARGFHLTSTHSSLVPCTMSPPPESTGARLAKPRGPIRRVLMDGLIDALSPIRRGSSDESNRLRSALGVKDGFVGLLQGVFKAGRVDRGIEFNQLEQRAWVRLGELVAFNDKAGLMTRLQTYWCMSWHISTFAASTTDLSTLALIMRPVSLSKAAALWDAARQREFLRPHEKLVLDNMSVDLAAEWLAKWQRWHQTERKGRCAACEKRTPLGVLAAILIRERLRKHAVALFVRTVVPEDANDDCGSDVFVYDAEKDMRDEQERTETVEAGKSIGGRTAELAVLLERIWVTGFCIQEEVLAVRRNADADVDEDCEDAHDLASTDEEEIRALLSATMIYRRIFPSSFPACNTAVPFVLSPPPSPSQRNVALHRALRTALGSPAFEFGSGGRLEDEELSLSLEDARDRVNDMLVDLEKSVRRMRR